MSGLAIEHLLRELGIEYKQGGRGNLKIKCINPNHDEKDPSMSIHKESGLLYCFGCSLKGNVFTLLHYAGLRGADVIEILARFSIGGVDESEHKKNLDKLVKDRAKQEEPTVAYANVILPEHRTITQHPYLDRRGITEEDAVKWNISVVTAGKCLGWIMIPLYQDGVLRNYFLRSTFGSGKQYGTYSRDDILAGIDFCQDFHKPLFVVEGIFDAIAVSHTGSQCVSALSNRLSRQQLNRMKAFKSVVVIPDNDNPGFDLVKSIFNLIHTLPVFVCTIPEGKKDASDCSIDELNEVVSKMVPIDKYLVARAQNMGQRRVV